ncbi:MAG: heavy metal-associated domain-containing protein [Christensenella sp.]
MNKVMKIDGMACEHCSARIEKLLNAMEGVRAEVSLADKSAKIEAEGDVREDELREVVENAGFQVISIS